MSWVDASVAKVWIRQHALQTPESSGTSNGQYDEGNTHTHTQSCTTLYFHVNIIRGMVGW